MAPGLHPTLPHRLGFSWLQSCLEACGPNTLEGPVVPWERLKRVGDRAPSLPLPPLPAAPSLGPKQQGPSQEATSQLAFLTPRTCLLAQASQGQGPHRTGFSSHPTWGLAQGCREGRGRGPPAAEKLVLVWALPAACANRTVRTGCSEPVPVTLEPWGPVWPGVGGGAEGLMGWIGGSGEEGGTWDPGLSVALCSRRGSHTGLSCPPPAGPASFLPVTPRGWEGLWCPHLLQRPRGCSEGPSPPALPRTAPRGCGGEAPGLCPAGWQSLRTGTPGDLQLPRRLMCDCPQGLSPTYPSE